MVESNNNEERLARIERLVEQLQRANVALKRRMMPTPRRTRPMFTPTTSPTKPRVGKTR